MLTLNVIFYRLLLILKFQLQIVCNISMKNIDEFTYYLLHSVVKQYVIIICNIRVA